MKFDEIRKKAIAEWEPVELDGIPVIRIGTATSDRASGSLEVVEEFEKELARLNVKAKIIRSGFAIMNPWLSSANRIIPVSVIAM